LNHPRGAALLADQLHEATTIIESWGIKVAASSRLPQAEALLRQTAARDQYPSDLAELHRLGNAIRVGFDFYHISPALTETPVPPVVGDLRHAVKGSLDDAGARPSNRAQTQVLFGFVLAVGGLRPRVPRTDGGPTPVRIHKRG
jgi:hypothetical protein